jgi:transposase InsO family protein
MGQVLHGSARTTEAVRRAIQLREESVRVLAKRYGVSPTTVQKWRRRSTTADAKMGPKDARSTVLTPDEEAIIVAFRRHTLLPLDDCLYGLQSTIPHLTRSTLHRCLERHGISRLPEVGGDKPQKKRFKAYPIGYFHIDIAEVSTEEGKLRLFVAIDRTSKFAFVRLVESAGKMEAAQFLRDLIEVVPYRIHTVLTDNGVQFTPRQQDIHDSRHIFDRVCDEHGIEHRLTKVNHPWTNGQVERMNRTIKDATVKRYHYDSHDQLRTHLDLFVDAYNHARRLKTLRGLTPHEFVCQAWTKEPERFKLNPSHHTLGPYTPFAVASLASAMPFLPQASKLVSGTSLRAGIEPFLMLKVSWNFGSITAAASFIWAYSWALPTFIMPSESLLKVTAPCVPG